MAALSRCSPPACVQQQSLRGLRYVIPGGLVRQTSPAPKFMTSSRDTRTCADPSHAGHAFLHDFCMTIPFGVSATAAGAISYMLGAGLVGMTAAAAGLMICLASYLSLQCWKQGDKSTLYTLISAGVAYTMWQQLQQGAATLPAGISLVASAVLALFCLYNILAGGNPPKKRSKVA